ncbi:MAG: MarR family transcriptional regulator [Kouleothrix sp.]|nr:MarR family transcriptional regulator [Kouleothrix sp.]
MPDAHECAKLLLETIPGLMRSMKGALRPTRVSEDEPLTMHQLRMMDRLRCRPLSLGDLAALQQVTPSTMSRAVDVLVRKAWVARQNDPNDRRQVVLTLTEEGVTAHEAWLEHTQDVITQMISRLDDDERARLYDGLTILRNLMELSGEPPTPDGAAAE